MISNAEILPALLRKSFPLFLRFAYQEIGGDGQLMWNFHLDAMIHRLEAIRMGDCRRQIMTLPPRHLKSVVMTAWVAWMLGNNPGLRFVCASYGQDLAEKHASDCLRLIRAPWFARAFPNLKLVRKSVSDFETTRGGYRLSTSVGGGLTGRGAHYVVIDDAMKADEHLNESARKSVINWFDSSLKWRLESQDTGVIILVMQRLHQEDLAGFLLERGGWDELRLPAIAPADELVEVGTNRFYQRREGHALHPARQSLAKLEELRAENPYLFAAQMDQDPVPLQGNWVSPSWFKTFEAAPVSGVTILSLDTASKTGLTNDYTVGIVARHYEGRFYILDVCRARVRFGELKALVINLCREYRVDRLLIEDAASGQALIQELQPPPSGMVWPIACKPESSKEVRFHAQLSKIEAGQVVLPETAPWMAEFVREVAAFPGGKFDDQADALAQLLRHGAPFMAPPTNAGPILFVDGDWVDENQLPQSGLFDDPWGAA